MPDLEKAIQWLEIERECVSRDCDRDCGKCDLAQDRETLLSACDDAISLLKAQEPRVMTLEEVKASNDPVFFENKSGVLCDWAINCTMNGKHVFFTIRNASVQTYRVDRYGISWRCWTSRPTDEQRKAAKWE